MIAIVDYGAGNVASVRKAIALLGADAALTADPATLARASMLVFPGQGHFGQAMARLRARGLDEVLQAFVATGKPFVGICLGVQLLFDSSDEAPGVAGLGLLPGHVRRFAERGPDGGRVTIPQIGWNRLELQRHGSPLDAIGDAHVYFVHSYHVVPRETAVVTATAVHGERFVAAVQRDNLLAVQFHPEKSGAAGLQLWSSLLGSRWWERPC